MKIIAISDTHGFHEALSLPDGDMLIHAGDITRNGTKDQVIDFLEWFTEVDFRYKVFIAGNHDIYLERGAEEEIAALIPDNVVYLNDSGTVIEGWSIWGSPVQPWFYDWAFNRTRGAEIQRHWDLIPRETDILITHGPAHGILDLTSDNESAGCEGLLHTIQTVKPLLHIAGHIHEGYGEVDKFGVKFINASVLDANYKLENAPIETVIRTY